VRVHKNHNSDPTTKSPSICFIDGDSGQKDSDSEKIFRLYEQCPESYIYDKVKDKIVEVKGRLTVALQLSYEKADDIEKIVGDVRLTNYDEHLLFAVRANTPPFRAVTLGNANKKW
jgi:hypothetical protein